MIKIKPNPVYNFIFFDFLLSNAHSFFRDKFSTNPYFTQWWDGDLEYWSFILCNKLRIVLLVILAACILRYRWRLTKRAIATVFLYGILAFKDVADFLQFWNVNTILSDILIFVVGRFIILRLIPEDTYFQKNH